MSVAFEFSQVQIFYIANIDRRINLSIRSVSKISSQILLYTRGIYVGTITVPDTRLNCRTLKNQDNSIWNTFVTFVMKQDKMIEIHSNTPTPVLLAYFIHLIQFIFLVGESDYSSMTGVGNGEML